jgi:glucokinase
VASAQALVKQAQLLAAQSAQTLLPRSSKEISLETIEQAFTGGDQDVCQAVLETGRYLGMAISNLVGTLNIHNIVLTGDMTRFGKPWLEAIREMITSTTLSRLAQETQVEFGQLGENGILMGASAMLANDYSLLFNPAKPRSR